MTFYIELRTADIHSVAEREYLEPNEDLELVAVPLCALLAEAGLIFMAGGFGDESWPVDVRYDLSSVIPQIPAVIESCTSGLTAELDFFEQGIQRKVCITYQGEQVTLRCKSYGDWLPRIETEVSARNDFVKLIVGFARSFAEAVTMIAPEAAVGLIAEWQQFT